MPSAGGLSFSPDSTSLWISALATYDLKPVTETVPLRFHLNLGYYVDSSGNLQDYDKANTSAYSRYVSRFGYGISPSRFRLALGVDAPIDEVTAGFALRPIVEYHFEYLTGSKDQVIAATWRRRIAASHGAAACADNKTQHWVTLGVQGQILRGLTLTVGLDIALRSPGYAYGPSLAPWNLLFGVGYPIDLLTRVVTIRVPAERNAQEEPLPKGLVAGRITTTNGTPIEERCRRGHRSLVFSHLDRRRWDLPECAACTWSRRNCDRGEWLRDGSARLDVIAGQTRQRGVRARAARAGCAGGRTHCRRFWQGRDRGTQTRWTADRRGEVG
jgi:hypothetical protein